MRQTVELTVTVDYDTKTPFNRDDVWDVKLKLQNILAAEMSRLTLGNQTVEQMQVNVESFYGE